ncbi:ATP-binding cassette sub-family A member [Elysia marginata]|uniref:ATP-binding cassette sub-family A member n=1 Tax=Elysia marginata TaxID=1093978 RepID=A0AAV4JCG0_9GAST|nr:ATP-binding cassette sub-family A member [Elysia marginata]
MASGSQVLTNFVGLYNSSALHAIPTLINLASQSILNSSGIAQTLTSASLPWPDVETKLQYNANVMSSGILLGIALITLLSGFATEIVRDREWKLRGQLRISGVSFNLYWGTIYLRDIVVFLIPCTAIIIAVIILDIKGLNSEGPILAMLLMFLTLIPFGILMIMVISFLFDKGESVMSYLPPLLQLSGMIPYIVVALVDMITQSNWAIILHYIFCVVLPPYLMFSGFYFISRVNLYAVIKGEEPTTSDYFDADSHILVTIILPIIHCLWMYWLLRVLDVRATDGNPRAAFPCLATGLDKDSDPGRAINDDVIEGEDEDVSAERSRVERLTSENTVNYSRANGVQAGTELQVVAFTNQLRKAFTKREKGSGRKKGKEKTKVAVRNLSVAVDKGEVLGLLGPNGAGKSTALNMMIAETAPTKGRVVVSGNNVRANAHSVLETLGYCPQHDALWETITLEEHVRCFAALKGIHPSQLEEVIDFYINNLKLQEHRKKASKKLSGGTKRKLSYIMSILGSPQLVLMDEPSTGMDPQSKRFLWDTINASFKNTSRGAVLTTHYMEEADALCDRVGIMVNGTLECLGATQHLKNKYGSGYILEVKLSLALPGDVEELMDQLEEHLKTLFPNMDTVERFMERSQYSIPKEDVKSLGTTFSSLEQCKSTHKLEEYSFSQSSLEQVFLYFAKKQLEDGEEDGDRDGRRGSPRRTNSTQDQQPQPV